MQRDVNGLYQRPLREEVPNFTGVSDPYEEPQNPEVVVETHQQTPQQSLHQILDRLCALGFLPYLEAQRAASHSQPGRPGP